MTMTFTGNRSGTLTPRPPRNRTPAKLSNAIALHVGGGEDVETAAGERGAIEAEEEIAAVAGIEVSARVVVNAATAVNAANDRGGEVNVPSLHRPAARSETSRSRCVPPSKIHSVWGWTKNWMSKQPWNRSKNQRLPPNCRSREAMNRKSHGGDDGDEARSVTTPHRSRRA
jgi:hypothetical protein